MKPTNKKNKQMKNLISYFTAIIIFSACTQAPNYKITGEITGHTGTIYLTHIVDGKQSKIDSMELVDSKFTFEGSVNAPEQYFLNLKKYKRIYIPFLIENSEISIVTNIKNRANAQIKGSALQDVMNDYNKVIKPFREKQRVMYKANWKASKTKNELKVKEVTDDLDQLETEMLKLTLDFIKNNNKSYAAAVIASYQRINEADEIDELIALLDASLMECDVVINMKAKTSALRTVAIGQIAPDFTMNDPQGNPIVLSSLFGKGYILIDFWASWCSPCRRENPHIVAAYNKYHEKGLEILGVSYDDNKEKWLKAIEKDDLPWLHVSDLKKWQNQTQKLYSITSIPSNFLLDKEGRIIAKNLNSEELKEKLAELID